MPNNDVTSPCRSLGLDAVHQECLKSAHRHIVASAQRAATQFARQHVAIAPKAKVTGQCFTKSQTSQVRRGFVFFFFIVCCYRHAKVFAMRARCCQRQPRACQRRQRRRAASTPAAKRQARRHHPRRACAAALQRARQLRSAAARQRMAPAAHAARRAQHACQRHATAPLRTHLSACHASARSATHAQSRRQLFNNKHKITSQHIFTIAGQRPRRRQPLPLRRWHTLERKAAVVEPGLFIYAS